MKEVDFYMRLPYTTRIRPDDCSDGSMCYFGDVLELPGCESHGDTPEEAQANLREAMELYIASMIEDGFNPPTPQTRGVTVVWRSERMVPETTVGENGPTFQVA